MAKSATVADKQTRSEAIKNYHLRILIRTAWHRQQQGVVLPEWVACRVGCVCVLYSTVNIVRLADPETCTRRIRLGRRLLAALDACYGKQISIPSLKFSTHSAQRCVTLNGCQTKEMEKQKKYSE